MGGFSGAELPTLHPVIPRLALKLVSLSKTSPSLSAEGTCVRWWEGLAAGGMAVLLRDVLDLRLCFFRQLDGGGAAPSRKAEGLLELMFSEQLY